MQNPILFLPKSESEARYLMQRLASVKNSLPKLREINNQVMKIKTGQEIGASNQSKIFDELIYRRAYQLIFELKFYEYCRINNVDISFVSGCGEGNLKSNGESMSQSNNTRKKRTQDNIIVAIIRLIILVRWLFSSLLSKIKKTKAKTLYSLQNAKANGCVTKKSIIFPLLNRILNIYFSAPPLPIKYFSIYDSSLMAYAHSQIMTESIDEELIARYHDILCDCERLKMVLKSSWRKAFLENEIILINGLGNFSKRVAGHIMKNAGIKIATIPHGASGNLFIESCNTHLVESVYSDYILSENEQHCKIFQDRIKKCDKSLCVTCLMVDQPDADLAITEYKNNPTKEATECLVVEPHIGFGSNQNLYWFEVIEEFNRVASKINQIFSKGVVLKARKDNPSWFHSFRQQFYSKIIFDPPVEDLYLGAEAVVIQDIATSAFDIDKLNTCRLMISRISLLHETNKAFSEFIESNKVEII